MKAAWYARWGRDVAVMLAMLGLAIVVVGLIGNPWWTDAACLVFAIVTWAWGAIQWRRGQACARDEDRELWRLLASRESQEQAHALEVQEHLSGKQIENSEAVISWIGIDLVGDAR